jgi:hypothetical protein
MPPKQQSKANIAKKIESRGKQDLWPQEQEQEQKMFRNMSIDGIVVDVSKQKSPMKLKYIDNVVV